MPILSVDAGCCGGEYDFGDEAEFRRGIDLVVEIGRKRYSRMRPYQPAIARQTLSIQALLYRLKARIDETARRDRSRPHRLGPQRLRHRNIGMTT